MKTSVEKGHFWEIKDLKENKGRVFDASVDIPENQAIFNWAEVCDGEGGKATNLLGNDILLKDNGLTLMCVSFKQFGFEMLPQWIDPIEKFLKLNKKKIVVSSCRAKP